MAAVSRDATVTYNSRSVNPVGPFSFEKTGTHFVFECEFIITGTTASAAATNFANVENDFNEWDKALLVKVASQNVHSYDPASGTRTGMLLRPSVEKLASIESTPLSRRYRLTVRGVLPGTETDKAGGLVEWAVRISYTSFSRRRMLVYSMTYTATGSNTALTNWDAGSTGATALADAHNTARGGDYELLTEDVPYEDTESQIAAGTLVYRERLIPETSGGGDSTSYTVDFLQIVEDIVPESHEADQSEVHIIVSWSCTVDATITAYDAMLALYKDTIRPGVLQLIRDTLIDDSSTPAYDNRLIIERDVPRFHIASSRITADWVVLAPTGFILGLRWSIETAINDNEVYRKIADGQHHSYTIYPGGQIINVRETVNAVTVDSPYDSPLENPGFFTGGKPAELQAGMDLNQGGQWRRTAWRMGSTVAERGQYQSETITVYTRSYTRAWRYIAPAKTAGGSAITEGPGGGGSLPRLPVRT